MDEEQEGVVLDDNSEEGVVLPEAEVEEEDEDTEQEGSEVEEEQEDETEEQEEVEVDKSAKEKQLLSALNEERSKRKALEKQLKSKKTETTTYDELVKAGVDEELAKTLANAVEKPSKDVKELRIENQILKLSKQEGFEGIEEYMDDIKDFVDKGLTVEQAYYACSGGKKSSRNTDAEMQRKYEAKMKNKQAKKEILNIEPSGSSPKVVEKKQKYTSLEAAAANAAGMSIEEYLAYKDMDTANDYDKYTKSKSKK